MVEAEGKVQINEESGKVEYPGSSVKNHHAIPRQDFNNYAGGKGGDDGTG